MMTKPDRLNPVDASKYLSATYNISRSVPTLAKLRVLGTGPLFRKIGAAVVYDRESLDAWAASITSEPVDRVKSAKGLHG